MTGLAPRSLHRHVRVYRSLRSAHLERAQAMAPASILYTRRRDDFDESLTNGLDILQGNVLRLFGTLVRSGPELVEINEPLMRDGLAHGLAAVLAARLSGLLRGRLVRIVAYAIENRDPFVLPADARLRTRLHTALDRRLAVVLAGRVDRIVFGTAGAAGIYRELLCAALVRSEMTTIPALPTACSCPLGTRDPATVVFVGALEKRKGFPALAAAWPHVRQREPSARLTVIGKGPLEGAARELAGRYEGVELLVDPPRAVIHRELRRSAVLVLLSRRTEHWREQVGLPIVEGLAHGCAVVTTDETGLASWLSAHGHVTVDPDAEPDLIARRIVGVLRSCRPARSVLADLPSADGRLEADEWMFAERS